MSSLTVHRGSGGHADPARCEGRLTLAAGHPDYRPAPTLGAPTSTDTGAETVTFAAAHGLTTGTIVHISATAGGLSTATVYYVRAVSSTDLAFYATLANAEADASRINLTASVTGEVQPIGVASTTVKFSPYNGNRVTLYNGSAWVDVSFSEVSVSVGGGGVVYGYLSSGALAIEVDGTFSATTVFDKQDGVLVKPSDATRRFLGIVVATNHVWTAIPASVLAVSMTLWNQYNRLLQRGLIGTAASHSYSSTTIRQWNADTALQFDAYVGQKTDATLGMIASMSADADARTPNVGWGSAANAWLTMPVSGFQLRHQLQASQLIRMGSAFAYPLAQYQNTIYIDQSAHASGCTFQAVTATVEYLG